MQISKKINIIILIFFILLSCSQKESDENPWLGLRLINKLRSATLKKPGPTLLNRNGSTTFISLTKLSMIAPKSASSQPPVKEFQKTFGNFSRIMRSTIGDGTANTDYEIDEKSYTVADPISENLKSIDLMLKTVSLTGYKWVLGKGAIRSVLSPPKDDSIASSGLNRSVQSLNKKTAYTLDVTEENDQLVAKIWGLGNLIGLGADSPFQAKLIVTQAPSTTNPYGDFTLGFSQTTKGYKANNVVPILNQDLFIKSMTTTDGKVDLQTIMKFTNTTPIGDNKNWVLTANDTFRAQVDVAKDSGQGKYTYTSISNDGKYNENGSVELAWDINFIYAKVSMPAGDGSGTNSGRKYFLKRNNPNKITYTYGMYKYPSGSRLNLITGFPFVTSDTGIEGWASRWGVNPTDYDPNSTLPTSASGSPTFTSGQKIKAKNFDGTFGDIYTVKVLPGILMKKTAVKTSLQTIKDNQVLLSSWNTNGKDNKKILFDGTYWIVKQSCVYDSTTQINTCTDAPANTYATTDLHTYIYNPTTLQYDHVKYIAYYNTVTKKWTAQQKCILNASTQTYTCASDSSDVTSAVDITYPPVYSFYMRGNDRGVDKPLQWVAGDTDLIGYDYLELDSLTSNLTLYNYSSCNNTPNGGTPSSSGTYSVSPLDLTLSLNGNVVTADVFDLIPASINFTPGSGSKECSKLYDPTVVTEKYVWRSGSQWYEKTVLLDSSNKIFRFDSPLNFTLYDKDKGAVIMEDYGFEQLYVPYDKNTDSSTLLGYTPRMSIPDGTKVKALYCDRDNNFTCSQTDFIIKEISVGEVPTLLQESDVPTASTLKVVSVPEADSSLLAKIDLGIKPDTTKVCVIEGSPVDQNGKVMDLSTEANRNAFCR